MQYLIFVRTKLLLMLMHFHARAILVAFITEITMISVALSQNHCLPDGHGPLACYYFLAATGNLPGIVRAGCSRGPDSLPGILCLV